MNDIRRRERASKTEAWLTNVGLVEYLSLFLQNDIDVETIPQLTVDDLREIGVVSVGHRRRLLDAIAHMSTDSARPEPIAEKRESAVASERRQVTTLFCDLVGFTPLAVRLDPESMHDVIGAYKDVCVAVVVAAGGHVLKFLGDGVLATFGYPKAGEDDAVRAVNASLELVRVVGRLTAPGGERLAARVGVATGVVVVGDQIGAVAVERGALIGETPNLAARLQASGEPGEVIVAESTRALLGNAFDAERLDERVFKGFSEPIAVYRIRGHRTAPIRFDARNVTTLTPIEGREGEIARLLGRRELASEGRGQRVAISGEAGIGKSRLVAELYVRLGATLQDRTILQCSPFHAAEPFYPLRSYLERTAGMLHTDSAAERIRKLTDAVARFGMANDHAFALLADLLEIDIEGSRLIHDFRSDEIRDRLMRTLLDLLERMTSLDAVLVVEDIQWCDPSTHELFDAFASTLRASPVLLVATTRPAELPAWLDPAANEVTVLALDRLQAEEMRKVVKDVAKPHVLEAHVLDVLVARSDGMPLFAEELTRAYLVRSAEPGVESLAIPSTLTESLLAQLDRLENARETVELAAVIGREFPDELLAAVSTLDAAALTSGVERLVAAGIFVRRNGVFGPSLAFRQSLVRDTAYGLLLRRERAGLHRLIADTIEARFARIAQTMPHLIAMHRSESGERDAAIAWWRRAASDAAARSAAAEAVERLQRAIDLTLSAPAGRERDELELELLLARAGPLIAAEGYGGARVIAENARSLELARGLGSPDRLVPALMHLWLSILPENDIRKLYDVANAIAELASDGSEVARLIAHRVKVSTHLFAGELALGRTELECFEALYDPARHSAPLSNIGATNHAVTMRLCRAEYEWLCGNVELAWRESNAAIAAAQEDGHVNTLAQAVAFSGAFSAVVGDRDELRRHATELKRLATRYDLGFWRPCADLLTGVAEISQGNTEAGFASARQGIATILERRGFLFSCWCVVFAGACTTSEHAAEGLTALAAAEHEIAKGERWFAAEVSRLRAQLRMLSGADASFVRADIEDALAIARAQGARLFEERALAELAT